MARRWQSTGESHEQTHITDTTAMMDILKESRNNCHHDKSATRARRRQRADSNAGGLQGLKTSYTPPHLSLSRRYDLSAAKRLHEYWHANSHEGASSLDRWKAPVRGLWLPNKLLLSQGSGSLIDPIDNAQELIIMLDLIGLIALVCTCTLSLRLQHIPHNTNILWRSPTAPTHKHRPSVSPLSRLRGQQSSLCPLPFPLPCRSIPLFA